MHTTIDTPTHRAKRPVSANSLREYEELIIKAQAKNRAYLEGSEAGETYEARELKKLYAYSDAEILAGVHRERASDVFDRLTNGGGCADADECPHDPTDDPADG